ncbi:MAG: hypothetical protein IPM23_12925 [Candidatus Melainabacteria bacterium]|nr:hypothetical protein [Candidatus Melainabacteria bacterium]
MRGGLKRFALVGLFSLGFLSLGYLILRDAAQVQGSLDHFCVRMSILATRWLEDSWIKRGRDLRAHKEYAASIDSFLKALKLNPSTHCDAYRELAELRESLWLAHQYNHGGSFAVDLLVSRKDDSDRHFFKADQALASTGLSVPMLAERLEAAGIHCDPRRKHGAMNLKLTYFVQEFDRDGRKLYDYQAMPSYSYSLGCSDAFGTLNVRERGSSLSAGDLRSAILASIDRLALDTRRTAGLDLDAITRRLDMVPYLGIRKVKLALETGPMWTPNQKERDQYNNMIRAAGLELVDEAPQARHDYCLLRDREDLMKCPYNAAWEYRSSFECVRYDTFNRETVSDCGGGGGYVDVTESGRADRICHRNVTDRLSQFLGEVEKARDW